MNYSAIAHVLYQKKVYTKCTTVAKLTNNKPVTMEVLERICKEFDCNIGDIVEFVKE